MKYMGSATIGRAASMRPPRRSHRERPTSRRGALIESALPVWINLFYCRSNRFNSMARALSRRFGRKIRERRPRMVVDRDEAKPPLRIIGTDLPQIVPDVVGRSPRPGGEDLHPHRAASAIAISIRFMSASPLSRLFTSGRATAARTGVRTRGATSSPSTWFPADWPRRRAARATYARQCAARTFFRTDPRESPS